MKILQVHNLYQQPGGEDQFSLAESQLLTRYDHEVERFTVHNDAIKNMSKMEVGARTIWNQASYRSIRKKIQSFGPTLVHAHNTFPLISPALYYAAEAERVPVVQTLHNYRLLCPAATFYRDHRVCEDCLHTSLPYPAVIHRCYRHSRLASATIAAMLTLHRVAGTWTNKVHTYIALTQFAKNKFIEGGLPAAKLTIKPIFLLNDPGVGEGNGGFALFVGRLSEEKGLRTLLQAWQKLPQIPLKIVGEGPLRDMVSHSARTCSNITAFGFIERSHLWQLLKAASILVLPSTWYEGLPAAAVEAMACGTPSVASDLGSLSEVIKEDANGLRFEAGNPDQLAARVADLLSRPDHLSLLRTRTRLHYEENYTAQQNYAQLLEIYQRCLSGYQKAAR